jgi:hypothetical protein
MTVSYNNKMSKSHVKAKSVFGGLPVERYRNEEEN